MKIILPKQHPFFTAGVLALLIYLVLTAFIDFTFSTDDWAHLASAQTLDNASQNNFNQWFGQGSSLKGYLSRVPVWALITWALFSSHILEFTWAPMYLFFIAHAGAVLLTSKWLSNLLAQKFTTGSPHTGTLVLAATVVVLHPNYYGILYWPTCMGYTVGGLFMALALWSKFNWRTLFLLLAFLTYETFFLPALCLLVLPALLSALERKSWRTLIQKHHLHDFAPWLLAAPTALLIRALAASEVGAFTHPTNLNLRHIGRQVNVAFNELFKIRFSPAVDTNVIASALQLSILILTLAILWKAFRWRPVLLVVLTFASSAIYWILQYSAMRALYGPQILFAALLFSLVVMADRMQPRYHMLFIIFLGVLGCAYLQQTVKILNIRHFNASVLAAQETQLVQQMRACPAECEIEHGALDRGLRRDWVLHKDYWGHYLEFMAAKYAPNKTIRFVFTPGQGTDSTPQK